MRSKINLLDDSPWGSPPGGKGGGNGSGRRQAPPNIDELIEKLQKLIGGFIPGGKGVGGSRPFFLGIGILIVLLEVQSNNHKNIIIKKVLDQKLKNI